MTGRVIMLASSELGRRCCEAIIASGVTVARILSIPRNFRISWAKGGAVTNVQYADLEGFADRNGIPFAYVTSGAADEYRRALGGVNADLIVVAGWYYFVPDAIRATARLGAIGVHASLLPKYRGGAPLVWAIINGERSAGVSVFHLASGVDDGDLIAQSAFEIAETDDISTVLERATERSIALVRDSVPAVLAGTAPRIPQNQLDATVMPQRTPADGLISWGTLTSGQAYDWIRAQTMPYPGAFTFADATRVTVWSARHATAGGASRSAGTVEIGAGVTVWCADGPLEIVDVGLADEPRMSAAELARRGVLRPGMRLGSGASDR